MQGRPPYCLKCRTVVVPVLIARKIDFRAWQHRFRHKPVVNLLMPRTQHRARLVGRQSPTMKTIPPPRDSLRSTTKRHLEQEADDPDFIPPNRPVRPQPSVAGLHVTFPTVGKQVFVILKMD